MIGLSTGAWAQVISNLPGVDSLTIVEINPGYLSLVDKYKATSSLLRNPRVHIVIDDGRRWLSRNPGRRFDVIVMNTTFHWRAHTTNLLSKEFVQLAHNHLRPGGIFHYNTTGSRDALKTGLSSFPYGMRLLNFVTVSDSPIHWDTPGFRSVLADFSIDGQKIFDLSRKDDSLKLDQLSRLGDEPNSSGWSGVESRSHALSRLNASVLVTDDNMVPEWKSTPFSGFPTDNQFPLIRE